MPALLSILLFLYWLVGPTLLSALLPPAGRLGREGTAVLLALLSWAVLAIWLPLRIWPPQPLGMSLGPAVTLGVGVLYAVLFLAGLVRRDGARQGRPKEGDPIVLALLSPLSEEVLFRGLLPALVLPMLGGYGTVAFTTLLFLAAHEVGRIGGAHRSLRETLADLAFGLFAGMLLLLSGTILAPLALHVLVNALYSYGDRSPAR